MLLRKNVFCILLALAVINCGGGSGGGSSSSDDTSDTVNTAKLVGTPFEGLEDGKDFDRDFFVCGDYRTESVDSLPIKIFAAFFTESEEAVIQEGIDIANTAMGPTSDGGDFYELTDTWTDDVRVIYYDSELPTAENADGKAYSFEYDFYEKLYSKKMSQDWAIAIYNIDKYVVAHELGHASGIRSHALIDYENDELNDLEENSLMQADTWIGVPALTDYTFMLEQQGEIIEAHLNEDATNVTSTTGTDENDCNSN